MSQTTVVDGVIYEIIETGSHAKFALVKDISKQNKNTTINIASYINDAPVVEISSEAFSDVDFVRVVNIPHTVDRIASWAFDNCKGLKVVEIETGKNSISLGNNAFARCGELKTIVFNGMIWLEGPGVFKDCHNLDNIPVVKEMLPDRTFYNCSSLNRVHVFGKTNIHNSVFTGSSIKELFCHQELSWIAADAESNEFFAKVTIRTPNITPVLEVLATAGQPVFVEGD